MKKDEENTKLPTFEQLPAMVADLSRKLDAFLERPQENEPATPMGVINCADFLTSIEGRKVTVGAVYNRVHKGILPDHSEIGLFEDRFLNGPVSEWSSF